MFIKDEPSLADATVEASTCQQVILQNGIYQLFLSFKNTVWFSKAATLNYSLFILYSFKWESTK